MATFQRSHICLQLLFAFLLSLSTSEGQCPFSCICENTITSCVNLTTIPNDIPDNTEEFILQYSSVSTINSGVFDGELLPNIRKIYLSNSQVREINIGAFSNLEYIQEIHLSGNEIVRIVNKTFIGLKLKALNLNTNKYLSGIDDGAFEDTTIEELHLRECNISYLNVDTLSPMTETLKGLYLTNNTAYLHLEAGLFNKFSFKELDLSDNDMDKGSLEAFRGVSAEVLDMSNNCLGDFIWRIVAYATTVKDLVFKRVCTNITEITKDIELQSLSLEGNYIREIRADTFRYSPRIKSLILKDNLITHIPTELGYALESLNILDLSDNKVTSVTSDDLDPLFKLEVLNLRNNRIQTLPVGIKTFLNRLKEFDIRDNPLHCNCDMLWFYDWFISLQYNISRVKVNYCAEPEMTFTQVRPSDFVCTPPQTKFKLETPVVLGQKVILHCNASADPSPTLYLTYKNQLLIIRPSETDLRIKANQLTYVIESVECSMIGSYTCTANNSAGDAPKALEVGADIDPQLCQPSTTPFSPATTTTITTSIPTTTTTKLPATIHRATTRTTISETVTATAMTTEPITEVVGTTDVTAETTMTTDVTAETTMTTDVKTATTEDMVSIETTTVEPSTPPTVDTNTPTFTNPSDIDHTTQASIPSTTPEPTAKGAIVTELEAMDRTTVTKPTYTIYSTTDTKVETTTGSDGDQDSKEEEKSGSKSRTWVIPVVIVLALLVLIAVVLAILLWAVKAKRIKLYHVDGRPHEMKVAYTNEGMQGDSDAKPQATPQV